jgi:probable rRNA maturation factor
MRVYLSDEKGFLSSSRRAALRRLAAKVIRGESSPATEVSIRLAGDGEITAVNRRFLGRPWPTDVISFPDGEAMPDGTVSLGDVVISCETAARNARRYRHSLFQELRRLVVHGTLHLLGHSHAKHVREAGNPEAHRKMRRLERVYLKNGEPKKKKRRFSVAARRPRRP